MAVLKSSIPYAKALFQLAKEKSLLSEIKSDANLILTALKQSSEFGNIISNPTISKSHKIEILTKLFATKIQSQSTGFLTLLVNKGRISEIASVCEAFIDMVNRDSNTIKVKLTTASQISDESQKQITAKILGKSNYEIEHVVNSNILGGYVLEFDNKMLDQSVSNKIQTIKNNLDK